MSAVKKRYTSVIITLCSVSLFVDGHYAVIIPRLLYMVFLPYFGDPLVQFVAQTSSPVFPYFCWNSVPTWCFATFYCFDSSNNLTHSWFLILDNIDHTVACVPAPRVLCTQEHCINSESIHSIMPSYSRYLRRYPVSTPSDDFRCTYCFACGPYASFNLL